MSNNRVLNAAGAGLMELALLVHGAVPIMSQNYARYKKDGSLNGLY